ncbi:MAG: M24 family metallopeptidase [Dehalococcoidia bacterium]
MVRTRNYGLGLLAVDYQERIQFDRMRWERMERAQAAVEQAGVELLCLFREENIRYLTSYRTLGMPYTSFGIRGAVLLPRGAQLVFYCFDWEEVERTCPWARDWLPHPFVSTIGIGSVSGAKSWLEDGQARLSRLGITPQRIGVDALTGAMKEALGLVFPQAELVDGQAILAQAQMVKTQDEVRCLENSGAITLAGLQAAREALRPGSRECEVQAAAYQAMTALGAEWTWGPGTVCSFTAPFRGYTSDRLLQGGEPVIVEVGARYAGYYTVVARTWVAGQGTGRRFQELHTRAAQALGAAKEALRPGATTRDVVEAARPWMTGDSLGHGIGISAVELPLLGTFPGGGSTAGEAVPLQPGAVLYLAPYVGEPEVGGVKLGDTVLVTEEGCETLTLYPLEGESWE